MLPIYFQTAQGSFGDRLGRAQPAADHPVGDRSVVSSGAVQKTGVAKPWLLVGAGLAAVGSGLFYTLDVGTGAGNWIGFQVVGGVG